MDLPAGYPARAAAIVTNESFDGNRDTPDVKRGALLLATVLLAASAAVAAPGKPPAPRVTVIDHYPVTAYGAGFRKGQRLTVVLVLGERKTRTVRANRVGSFVARFQEHVDSCRAFTLRVLSGQSVQATARHTPARSCASLDPG